MLNKNSKIAFVFPGQGSQSKGMLSSIAKIYPIIQETFEEVSDTLNFNAWQLVQENPQDKLNQTQYTQPLLLAGSVSLWRLWSTLCELKPIVLAGHSLGEYSALVSGASLSLADASRIVFKRGELMQKAVPKGVGAMAAVVGLEPKIIDEVCAKLSKPGAIVSSANYNSLNQTVIAGHMQAVEACMYALQSLGAKRVIKLSVSVPSHCSLMKEMANLFGQFLQDFKFKAPIIPVVHNVDLSSPISDAAIKEALKLQLYSPVRWLETVELLVQSKLEYIVECGPGQILCGLNKRIAPKSVQCVTISEPENIEALLNTMLSGGQSCL